MGGVYSVANHGDADNIGWTFDGAPKVYNHKTNAKRAYEEMYGIGGTEGGNSQPQDIDETLGYTPDEWIVLLGGDPDQIHIGDTTSLEAQELQAELDALSVQLDIAQEELDKFDYDQWQKDFTTAQDKANAMQNQALLLQLAAMQAHLDAMEQAPPSDGFSTAMAGAGLGMIIVLVLIVVAMVMLD